MRRYTPILLLLLLPLAAHAAGTRWFLGPFANSTAAEAEVTAEGWTLTEGMAYYDTTADLTYEYDGSGWDEIDANSTTSGLAHTQGTDQGLDTGGASAVTAAQAKAASDHVSADGSSHTYIDQNVTSGSSPTFDGNNFSGVDADDVDTDTTDWGEILSTEADVQAALDTLDTWTGGGVWQMDMGEVGDDNDWTTTATDPLTGIVCSGACANYDTLQRTGGTGIVFSLNGPGADREATLTLDLSSITTPLPTMGAMTIVMEVSVTHLDANVDNFQCWLRSDDWKDYTILKFEYDGANRKVGHATGRNTAVAGVNWANVGNWNSANSLIGLVRGAQEQQAFAWAGGALSEPADTAQDGWITDDGTRKFEIVILTKNGGYTAATIHNIWIGGMPTTYSR